MNLKNTSLNFSLNCMVWYKYSYKACTVSFGTRFNLLNGLRIEIENNFYHTRRETFLSQFVDHFDKFLILLTLTAQPRKTKPDKQLILRLSSADCQNRDTEKTFQVLNLAPCHRPWVNDFQLVITCVYFGWRCFQHTCIQTVMASFVTSSLSYTSWDRSLSDKSVNRRDCNLMFILKWNSFCSRLE